MISCCGIRAYPHERDRKKAGGSDERIQAVAGGRDALFCTDAVRAALALTWLSDRADQPGYPDSRTRH